MAKGWIANRIGSELFVLTCSTVGFVLCTGAATAVALFALLGLGLATASLVSFATWIHAQATHPTEGTRAC
jgi:hypothetical protein